MYIKKNVINEIFRELYPDNLYLIDGNHIEEIFKVIESNKKNIELRLPNEITVIKEYNNLYFNKNYGNLILMTLN